MKYKYFLKNLSIFTISSFISKLLLFIMLPFYTNILSVSEYGVIDIISTTVQLAIPIFSLCITEGIIRFTLDNKEKSESILRISFKIFIKGYLFIILLSLFSILVLHLNYIYVLLFNLYYIALTISNIYTYYLKGMEKIKVIGISSIIKVLVLVLLNCLFLLKFNLGIIGYYASAIISELVNIIILIIYDKRNSSRDIIDYDYNLEKKMIDYSKHFVINSISWWINNASDKYIVLLFFGASLTGVYSVSYKIPTIIEFVQNIYAQAWQISAIKEYNNDDSKAFFSTMYNCYNIILVFVVFGLLLFLKVIARILFAKEFYAAWQYVPFLLMAILFGALSGFLGSIYAANKDSKMYAKSTAIGAFINIMLNFILIPIFGAHGAAIATFISYFIIWLIRITLMKKYVVLNINHARNTFSYLILVFISIIVSFIDTNLKIPFVCFLGLILIILNYNDLKTIARRLIKWKK